MLQESLKYYSFTSHTNKKNPEYPVSIAKEIIKNIIIQSWHLSPRRTQPIFLLQTKLQKEVIRIFIALLRPSCYLWNISSIIVSYGHKRKVFIFFLVWMLGKRFATPHLPPLGCLYLVQTTPTTLSNSSIIWN